MKIVENQNEVVAAMNLERLAKGRGNGLRP